MSAVSGSAPIFVDGRRGRESEVWLKTFYTGRRHFSNEAFNKRQEKFFLFNRHLRKVCRQWLIGEGGLLPNQTVFKNPSEESRRFFRSFVFDSQRQEALEIAYVLLYCLCFSRILFWRAISHRTKSALFFSSEPIKKLILNQNLTT